MVGSEVRRHLSKPDFSIVHDVFVPIPSYGNIAGPEIGSHFAETQFRIIGNVLIGYSDATRPKIRSHLPEPDFAVIEELWTKVGDGMKG